MTQEIEAGVLDRLLKARGLEGADRERFLSPAYEAAKHDPFLLPDMDSAVKRIVQAHKLQERVYIYGDYDIDGLTATTILREAFSAFGILVDTFIPNRFVDGYGLSVPAIETLAREGAQLIVTVDCGSLSHAEIMLANELGMDVIVTDHHSVAATMPPAVATINPKRTDHEYPFIDLAGCGVAFKLVQALQQHLKGLPAGQEKWLLDLVALGTVCDVVSLVDENRANVYWGLHVMRKTRRHGIRALASVAGLALGDIDARSLGFVLGPHLNAAGRLETAQLSLDLLTATDSMVALAIAEKLHEMNKERRKEQDRIAGEAKQKARAFINDPVLVLSDPSWSHGIIGIVAAKMLEAFHKPTFVLQEMGEQSKGSARSFGDFSAVEGIRAADRWLIRGGGHKLAAGVTLATENIPNFRACINEFYRSLKLDNQAWHLEPVADVSIDSLDMLNLELIKALSRLEPYGHGNPEPVFHIPEVTVCERRTMGAEGQHLKLYVTDASGLRFALVGFNRTEYISADVGDMIGLWMQLAKNEWRGVTSAEGRILKVIPL